MTRNREVSVPPVRARVPVERSSPHPRWPQGVMSSEELAAATARLIAELKESVP